MKISDVSLQDWCDEQAKECFVPDYLASAATDEDKMQVRAESLGIRISQMIEWDGERIGLFIARVMASGLEDANWHTEAAVFYDMIKKMENGAMIGEVISKT